ncbi:MAG: hypothetical protein JXB19_01795 [Bacteroidales bacterium]|nr:hypothetical protein [Bacteroidales bacterium]
MKDEIFFDESRASLVEHTTEQYLTVVLALYSVWQTEPNLPLFNAKYCEGIRKFGGAYMHQQLKVIFDKSREKLQKEFPLFVLKDDTQLPTVDTLNEQINQAMPQNIVELKKRSEVHGYRGFVDFECYQYDEKTGEPSLRPDMKEIIGKKCEYSLDNKFKKDYAAIMPKVVEVMKAFETMVRIHDLKRPGQPFFAEPRDFLVQVKANESYDSQMTTIGFSTKILDSELPKKSEVELGVNAKKRLEQSKNASGKVHFSGGSAVTWAKVGDVEGEILERQGAISDQEKRTLKQYQKTKKAK